jgi:ornithine cyclodeaminase/alanine dehydrogenase-like protein (mu-crystallin family)
MRGAPGVDVLDAATVARLLRPLEAVQALEGALRSGLDPARTTPRASVAAPAGELLLMPAIAGEAAGVKVVGVAPGNARLGLPRIQGLYLLFDASTLTPRAVLDGAALTTLRTPAVSAAAVRAALVDRPRGLHAVVFGAGPQAVGHLRALADVLAPSASAGVPVLEAAVVVRNAARAALPRLDAVRVRVLGVQDGATVQGALREADVVVCATTAREPLFPADVLKQDAVVVAVGAHEPDAQEVETALAGRATVVVEDRATALREAGVVRAAVHGGLLAPEDVVPMRDVVRGSVPPSRDRPLLFVSVGMAWEDLVVADRLHRAHQARPAGA